MSSLAATQYLPVVATGSATQDFLVVSVHDVAPSTRPIITQIMVELARQGVRSCSLLVVPDYHRQGPSMQDRQFVAWLRELETAGHEIVIHGYFHERSRRGDESLFEKFVTQIYTNGEGEFYDLRYGEALRRIKTAREEFWTNGLKPRGFVAPAWLLSPAAERAAHDAEMEYTTRLRTVLDLRSRETFAARSIVYSVRNSWRRATSLLWNAALARVLAQNPLLRVSIHPADYSHPIVWRQIVDLIKTANGSRTVTTYQDWIGQQRVRRAA